MKRYLKNIYVIATIFFLIWMAFFDVNSWFFTHSELSDEIESLEFQRKTLRKEIKKDQKTIRDLNSGEALETFGRENYYLNRDNEDTYIIEFDTIPYKN